MSIVAESGPSTKWCSGCSRTLNASEFYRRVRSRDGLAARCKACCAAYQTKYKAKLKAEERQPAASKWCPKCGRFLLAVAFWRSVSSPDGLHGWCISCCRPAMLEYQRANYERRYEMVKRWTDRNVERKLAHGRKTARRQYQLRYKVDAEYRKSRADARAAYGRAKQQNGGKLRAGEWRAILDFYDHSCLRCGANERLTVDHVVPVSKGGRNEAANVQPLCINCSASKKINSDDYRDTYLHGVLLSALEAEALLRG